LPDLDAGTDADGNPISVTHPLRYRPAHYVPFKVPLFDEQYTQIQQDLYDDALEDNPDNNIKEPEPLYRWYYRPELQFSQYDFDAKSLIVKQTDSEGNETETSIDISKDGSDFGPLFDEYTDSVELLFDLLGPELETLPPLENDREFILSLGGEEVLATIGQDGKVVFENPEHLNQLSEEDLLSLRLYLNGDSANVLWEYQVAGFAPYWSIYPDQQPQRIRKSNSVEQVVAQQIDLPLNWFFPAAYAEPTNLNVEDQGSYFTLGGMRIKLIFQTEKSDYLGAPEDIIWESNSIVKVPEAQNNGTFFKEEKPDATAYPDRLTEGAALSPSAYLYQVYFEPPSWETGQNIEITAKVRYKNDPRYKQYQFNLKTRELYPVSESRPNIYNGEDPQAPLQGADVAMLEDLLWQLGISPQYNSPGKAGARINSDRGTHKGVNYGWTKNCQGEEARARDVYSVGWDSTCADESRENGVSMEGMVRRFQGRSFDVPNGDRKYVNLKGKTDTSQIHGRVDDTTLAQLAKVWEHYREAVFKYQNPQYRTNNLADTSWQSAATMLTSGGRVPYENSSAYNILASYTAAQHTSLKTNFPEAANGFTVKGLIQAWTKQESGNIHWGGTDTNPAIYRLYEGSADEQGSMGFNHIVWKRLYGTENDCDEVRGYIGDTSNVNMYNPTNSLYGLIVAGAHASCSSSNGLHEAFVDGDYATAIPVEDRPSAYCYEGVGISSDSAADTRCANIINEQRAVHNFTDTQDAGMHLLGEALAGYNAGSRYPDPGNPGTQVLHYFGDRMLDCSRSITGSGDYVRTKFGYWMAIKGHTQDAWEKMSTDDRSSAGYLPYTTYIWPNNLTGTAALGVDLNRDGTISTVANADGIIEANTPWCYAYGELEWMKPFSIVEPGRPARYAVKADYLNEAIDDPLLRVKCL